MIDDAMVLVELIVSRRPRFPVRHLPRFVELMVRDYGKYLASERDAMINAMASICGCSPATIRLDIERVTEARSRLDDEEALERITGMTGPEPGADLGDADEHRGSTSDEGRTTFSGNG